MASSNDFNSLLSQLQELEKSKDYLNFGKTKNIDFDPKISGIIGKWISNDTLSTEEKTFIDSYSNLQLSFVEYCLFNSDTKEDVQPMIEKFPGLLFKKSQTDVLAEAVEFIRTQSSNNNNSVKEDDLILVYLMRMIDARSLAYRLCFIELSPPPDKLNKELKACLADRQGKDYLYDIKSNNETDKNLPITDRHKFFIGCCTFAVALYEGNRDYLKDNDGDNKYICLLAKYVRILLTKENFAKNESILHCIRGVLALLTNCVPTASWLIIMNDALANENNEDAQAKNPFNINLFSLIINKLLASASLQIKAKESGSNKEILLLDTALVFLNKWSDTQADLSDEVDENNNSSPFDKPNQLLRCFCSHEEFQQTVKIIIPYVDVKYDRLRLMAVSILSLTMDAQDFEDLNKRQPNITKDLIKLIFEFINQAEKRPNHKYKGISFELLLRYLLRFLLQDSVKEETLPYVSKIVDYAQKHHLYALKILRKISINPKLRDNLLKNVQLEQFLKTGANDLYSVNPKMYKIVEDIRRNLVPPKPTKPLAAANDDKCQAFISYCHEDKEMCRTVEAKLKETELFTKVWVDKYYMRDNMIDTVVQAISESKVVFVLVSDNYCLSDFCRLEWEFARGEKIKVYAIIVQKGFDKKKCDWARFLLTSERYYKLHDDIDFGQLIENLSERINKPLKHESSKKTHEIKTEPASPPPSTPDISINDRKYLTKPSIATWTYEDIRNWCLDRELKKWLKLLTNFDGQDLLVLRQDLSNDSQIQYIVKGNDLDGFDIARFKSEIDKISTKTMTTNKPSTKKNSSKRRLSKSSLK